MGGRGANISLDARRPVAIKRGNVSIAELERQYQTLGNRMAELGRHAADMTPDERQTWNSLKEQSDNVRRQLSEAQGREARESRSSTSNSQPHTFVNSYGEATTREIGNSTYDRERRKREREARRIFMGSSRR